MLVNCGTNLIVGILWHECYFWYWLARTLLLVFCGKNLIVGILRHNRLVGFLWHESLIGQLANQPTSQMQICS